MRGFLRLKGTKIGNAELDNLPVLGTNPSSPRQIAIVNAEIDAAAGIVDTKLAQIATASKVSGAALTGLASVPSGAGELPIANMSNILQQGYDASDTIESTTSAFYVDSGDISIVLTTGANPVYVFASCAIGHSNAGLITWVNIMMDTTNLVECRNRVHTGEANLNHSVALVARITPTAASHTFKMQFKQEGGGTAYLNNKRLIVLEVKE